MSMSRRPLRPRPSRLARCAIVAVAVGTSWALPTMALAQPKEDSGDVATRRKEAQVFFDDGVKLAHGHDYEGALSAFRAAYDRYPSFRVLYNIGQLCERTHDVACTYRAYDQYLRDGGADVPVKRREALETTLRGLSRRLAWIVVRADATANGAEVTLDAARIGTLPLSDRLVVNPGVHKLVATQGDHHVEEEVSSVAGQVSAVTLILPTDPPRTADETPSTTTTTRPFLSPPSSPARRPFPVLPWVVTGALGVGTVVSGVLANQAYGDFQTQRDSFPVSRSALDDAQSNARNLSILTASLGAATVVSLGVSAYFTWWAPPPKVTGRAQPIRVGLAPSLGGLSIVGTMP